MPKLGTSLKGPSWDCLGPLFNFSHFPTLVYYNLIGVVPENITKYTCVAKS